MTYPYEDQFDRIFCCSFCSGGDDDDGHICVQPINHDGPHYCGPEDQPCAKWTDE